MRLSEVQPEFKMPIWDYLGFLVDEQRVADGRAMMRQYEQILRAANYLKRSGWQPGDPWMIEVTVPRGYDEPTGRGNISSLSSWARRKVLRGDGAQLSAGAPVVYKQPGLLLPAGPQGPGFLVFRNFDAIYSYNQAESYALAISHLADRLAGHPPPGLTPGDPVGTE